jgi:NAD-dependent SIR2 family protein deacetylase
MGKKVLKVREDFYQQNLFAGDIVYFMEGKYKILDTQYRNQYGPFILCEYLEEFEENTLDSIVEQAIPADPDNPYEIIGTIHLKGYRNLFAGPGFFVKNRKQDHITGMSFKETLQILMREGATNATATRSISGVFHSSTIDSIEGLPSFDSHYWKREVYDQNGKAFAELTDSAKREVHRALPHAIRNLISDYQKSFPGGNIEEERLIRLREEIDSAPNIVILTGAGVSTMSGIPDYRSSMESLWVKDPHILARLNDSTFSQNPGEFWAIFYKFLQKSIANILPFPTHEAFLAARKMLKPNQVHKYFAALDADKNITVVTQNVDGFHGQAGSKRVIEFHGNVHECVCPNCHQVAMLDLFIEELQPPVCECGVVMRPNVVFFGDEVKGYQQAIEAMKEADLILVAGTSLQVYPFNTLLDFKKRNAKTVLVNAETPHADEKFELILNGNVSDIVYRLAGVR